MSSEQGHDEIMRKRQAADFAKVSERTLDRQKDLPRVRLSARLVGYRKSDLIAWVQSRVEAA